ncbi:hypothetical protein [Nocardia bhagyanarayanae]|uniref:Uncharacterized protein n=1 Tax=Nocardia bhagyanarayanae TaxID=1215925 RepID=A0A543FG18_9NOCA|nr:hypothetical protein [Nocardia bhagyanarayanae]TQM32696.1 hypothetical protein FB390_4391 [Nocardia bhagyanarayanae]
MDDWMRRARDLLMRFGRWVMFDDLKSRGPDGSLADDDAVLMTTLPPEKWPHHLRAKPSANAKPLSPPSTASNDHDGDRDKGGAQLRDGNPTVRGALSAANLLDAPATTVDRGQGQAAQEREIDDGAGAAPPDDSPEIAEGEGLL